MFTRGATVMVERVPERLEGVPLMLDKAWRSEIKDEWTNKSLTGAGGLDIADILEGGLTAAILDGEGGMYGLREGMR